ncbi:MAG: leucine dehydrogenase [Candidatus Tectimicrobiota bacterium]|nr:MAG: leucine dehydrogenase [Candidatus Tectomicrobia bacterium]
MKLTEIPVAGYEKVVRGHDAASGLLAYISVHDTTLGPAVGGIRMWPYSSEEAAFADANRLARTMTYKSAVADTGLGGGKAVILGDPQRDKSPALLRAMGRFIAALGGLYIGAEDVGITAEDLVVVRQETRFVAGLPRHLGSSGNPAPFTALGVFLGMQVCLEWQLHTRDMAGVRVAVQGCGSVAQHLCRHLHAAGARLIVTDIIAARAQRLAAQYGARLVAPEAIYDVECEIFAPCALGGVINDDTLPRLRCQIVAGCANNPCLTPEHGEQLAARGILYAPDFVINAGGILNISVELEPEGYREARALAKVQHVPEALRAVFALAREAGLSPARAALELAEQKLAAARRPPRAAHAP